MATQARIERRRMDKRNGHSVKCWKSKWDICKCKISGARPGESKYA
jgi:hypothetical protein